MSAPSNEPVHVPVSVTAAAGGGATGGSTGVGVVGLESSPHVAVPNATRQRTNRKRALLLFNVNRPDAFL